MERDQRREELRAFEGDREGVASLAFSPDGRALAAGSGKDIKLWAVLDGAELHTFVGRSSLVNSIVFSPDGKTLARSSGENASGCGTSWPGQSCARSKDTPITSCQSRSALTASCSPAAGEGQDCQAVGRGDGHRVTET